MLTLHHYSPIFNSKGPLRHGFLMKLKADHEMVSWSMPLPMGQCLNGVQTHWTGKYQGDPSELIQQKSLNRVWINLGSESSRGFWNTCTSFILSLETWFVSKLWNICIHMHIHHLKRVGTERLCKLCRRAHQVGRCMYIYVYNSYTLWNIFYILVVLEQNYVNTLVLNPLSNIKIRGKS